MGDSNNDEIRSVAAKLEGKPSRDRVVRFDVHYYRVDEQYARELLREEAYRQTRAEDLKARHMPRTVLKEATDAIATGGLNLVSSEQVRVGDWLVMDMEVPQMVQRVRLLGQTVPGRHGDGITRDDTAASFRCGIDIVAVNRNDLRRAENQAITRSMDKNR